MEEEEERKRRGSKGKIEDESEEILKKDNRKWLDNREKVEREHCGIEF